MAILHHLNELLVDPCIVRQFGMEGRSQYPALAHQYRIVTGGSQNFHAFSCANDLRRTDEYHLQWLLSQFALRFADGAFKLAAIGVAADTNVHYVQRLLWRVLNMLG